MNNKYGCEKGVNDCPHLAHISTHSVLKPLILI